MTDEVVVENLQFRIAELEKALRWYTNPNIYTMPDPPTPNGAVQYILYDQGANARAALPTEENKP